MQIKIKKNAWKMPEEIKGQWVEVDTTHVFNNQYNIVGYNIRVMDESVEAVRDDVRAGVVGCGYCGKQFHSMEELQAHYLQEEEKAHVCAGCFWYRDKMVDVIRDNSETVNDNGQRIQTNITRYVWEKQCTHAGGCDRFEHRNHKPVTFTPENTHFLKYPNGYAAHFAALPVVEKWAKMGFIWKEALHLAIMPEAIGTYFFTIHYDDNGKPDGATLHNTRRKYEISGETLHRLLTKTGRAGYYLNFDDNGKRLENSAFADFPKTLSNQLDKFFYMLQDACQCYYKRPVILGSEENENV